MANSKTNAKAPRERPLSARERLFAHVLATTPGIPQLEAARQAGYTGDNTTLSNTASRLMARARVASLVEELRQQQLQAHANRGQRILDEIHHVALARLSRVIGPDGQAKPLEEWGEEEKAALTELDIEEIFNPFAKTERRVTDDGVVVEDKPKPIGRILTAKMHGKLKALELAAKHHRLIVDKAEVDVNVKGHAELVEEALRRYEEKRAASKGAA